MNLPRRRDLHPAGSAAGLPPVSQVAKVLDHRNLKQQALNISIGLLTALAVLTAIGPLFRAQFLAEIDINEGWIAYHVDAVLRGLPLYPSPDQLITNNYPPLFYYLAAGLSSVFGNTIYAGRALSFAALLAVGVEVFAVLRELGVRRLFAFVAAIAYFATMCRLFDGRVAVNDPQLLAHAVMGLGLLAFLIERRRGHRWFLVSATTMVLAGFVKNLLIAVPIGTFLFLLLEDRKSAARFAVVGSALALGGLWLCALVYGESFVFNVFEPRPYSLARGFKAFEDLHRVPVQFLLWIWYAVSLKDNDRGRLVNLLCLCGLAESFIARTAEEVDRNAGYDLVIALHLALGAALERAADLRPAALLVGTTALRTILVATIALRLLFGEPMDSFNILLNPAMARYFSDSQAATLAEAERVQQIPGPVFCESPFTCFLAGKPFVVDGINLQFRIATGRVPCDVIDRKLRSGELTYVPNRTGSPNLRPYRVVTPPALLADPGRKNSLPTVSPISCK